MPHHRYTPTRTHSHAHLAAFHHSLPLLLSIVTVRCANHCDSRRYAITRDVSPSQTFVTVAYDRLIQAALQANPSAVADKWSAARAAAVKATPEPGPPLKPQEILLIGKVHFAVQRVELGRSPTEGKVDFLTLFRGVDYGRSGRLPWKEVQRVVEEALALPHARHSEFAR
jgi:hypothetical protein